MNPVFFLTQIYILEHNPIEELFSLSAQRETANQIHFQKKKLELGFGFIFVLLCLFALLIFQIVKLAFESNDRFSSLILIGIGTIFLSHIFVNTAMAVGLIPVKGLPLPFISAGGSFLLSCFMMIGLSLNMGINTIK